MAVKLAFILVTLLETLTDSTHAIEDVTANKFMVRFSLIPDPLRRFSFYPMPRTLQEAGEDHFTLAVNNTASDHTTVHCRNQDYRVCVLFDLQGSVAGIQISVAADEIQSVSVPQLFEKGDYWIQQQVLGVDVYSAVTYFVSEDILLSGGRPIDATTLTAPEGLFLRSRSDRLNLPLDSDDPTFVEKDFVRQGCMRGMGYHYYQGLHSTTRCEDMKPYFILSNPEPPKVILGFGIQSYGKVSSGHQLLNGWFERPPPLSVDMAAPYAAPCVKDWARTYGMFSLHVYFVSEPWSIHC